MESKITTARSPRGRLLTIEHIGKADSTAALLESIAKRGGADGYILLADEVNLSPLPPPKRKAKNDRSLHMGILIHPAFSSSQKQLLSVIGALALRKTVRLYSGIEASIRWPSDVVYQKETVGTVGTVCSFRENGSFHYAIVDFSLRIMGRHFSESLPKIVENVFAPVRRSLTERMADTLVSEFFSLYEEMALDRSFLDEYREHSILRGKRVRFLQGEKKEKGIVIGIDDSARLVIAPKRGGSYPLSSPDELLIKRK